MNKHTKLAIFIAPFLLLGGYIASDYYLEYQASQDKVVELVPDGHCDVINETCVFAAGDLLVNVYDKNGVTGVNSTYPIDSAVLFIVDSAKQYQTYNLAMANSPYYWQQPTDLRERISEKGEKQRMRVIVTIKGGKYISEFYSQTVQ
ncbi:hypothetical protein [Thalassotalea euphylliae]|uniref:Uncharacterized protein n=1 Tax=Thalassotalea euphylliae TaxID=1655234 RepID=A0A3E0U376_9GAMM|nr:hypothetical protein [Thalassotalea euphylliae]REL31180.1 hypothetical protein DXX94_10900 [Thalassotalea euphylliae]